MSNHQQPRPRWDIGARGVQVLAAFAVVVAVIAAVLAWRARPEVIPVTAPSAPVPVSTDPDVVVVAVTGKVRRPGLVRLPAGARVADAIEAAGGVLPGTDITGVNLARKVTDGELIAVGVSPAVTPGSAATADGLVNLNTATLAQLQTLPGVGPVLAQRIVDYRSEHGGFQTIGELRKVSGIGAARFAQLKDLVTV